MPTANEEILNEYLKHQTYLLRYASSLTNTVSSDLIKTEKKLFEAILLWVSRAVENRTLSGDLGRKWQKDFEIVLNRIRRPAWDKINTGVMDELKELSKIEAATGLRIIEGAVPVAIGMSLPPVEKLISIVNSMPFQGRTLKRWLNDTADVDVNRILNLAKNGIVQGQTPTQIARSVIGTRQSKYKDGVARKSLRDLEATLLTVTNGIQNEAKQALYEANSDIIKQEYFVATLDAKTTLVCMGYDGDVFNIGEGPMPPLHFRCRSLRIPYLNPDNIRNRGFDSSFDKKLLNEYTKKSGLQKTNSRIGLPRGHKTKFDNFARVRKKDLIGQVPAKTTYNEWFKRQDVDFQNEVLGPTRAKMFRSGEITLDKFTSPAGDVYTLDQLEKQGLTIPTNKT